MADIRFNRRVNVRFTMNVDENVTEQGDLMIPEPILAANLVGTLLQDWSVTDISITAQNSMTEAEEEDDAEANQ